MDEGNKLVIGEVSLVPLIVLTIQLIKRFFPDAPGNVWLALAYVLGLLGQFVAFLISKGDNIATWNFATWAILVVSAMWWGLTATQSWDNIVKPELARRAANGGSL